MCLRVIRYCARRSSFVVDGPDTMPTVRALAKVAHLHARCGNVARSEAILTACLAAAGSLVGTGDPEYAVLLFQLGSLHQRAGDLPKAISTLRACCDIFAATAAKADGGAASSISPQASATDKPRGLSRGLSFSSRRSGQSCLASPHAATTTRDSFHRQTSHASALLALGQCFHAAGELANARKTLEEALSVQTSTGGKHTLAYVSALRSLATVLAGQRMFRQADALLLECVALCPLVCGPASSEYSSALRAHAEVQSSLGQWDRAAGSLASCVDVTRRVPGGDPVPALQQLGALYVTTKRYAKAVDTLLAERACRLERGDGGT